MVPRFWVAVKRLLVPGKRNLARERADHARTAHRLQQQTYDLLTARLPAYERALIGRQAILTFLHDLGVRRRNGALLTWRMLQRWRRDLGFPLVRGLWSPHAPSHPNVRSPPFSTAYAVTAWLLSRFSSDEHGVFRVGYPTARGNAPCESAPERIASADRQRQAA